MNSPLDLAAQITLISWSLTETPNTEVEGVLSRALELGGIVDIEALKLRKIDGKTVFGQLPSYPQASAGDVEALRSRIASTIANLETIETTQGVPVANGSDWEEYEISVSTLKLSDVAYSAPL